VKAKKIAVRHLEVGGGLPDIVPSPKHQGVFLRMRITEVGDYPAKPKPYPKDSARGFVAFLGEHEALWTLTELSNAIEALAGERLHRRKGKRAPKKRRKNNLYDFEDEDEEDVLTPPSSVPPELAHTRGVT